MPAVPPSIAEALRNFKAAKEAARKLTNQQNKAKTAAKNQFRDYVRNNNYPAGTVIIVDGVEYTYGPSQRDIVPPREWYAMYISKAITEEQFFDALSVSMTEAKNAVGDDQLLSVIVTDSSGDADIRINDENVAKHGEHTTRSIVPQISTPRAIPKKAAPVQTIATKPMQAVQVVSAPRKINLRRL